MDGLDRAALRIIVAHGRPVTSTAVRYQVWEVQWSFKERAFR
jgi:hypothetical protein